MKTRKFALCLAAVFLVMIYINIQRSHTFTPVSYTHLVEVCMVSFHNFGKLADVEHIAQTAHVKVVIIQMFQPCRAAAPIRVIHLNHAAIWNAVEIVIVAVDETNILRPVSYTHLDVYKRQWLL